MSLSRMLCIFKNIYTYSLPLGLNNIIPENEIKYFYCLINDITRIYLIILYFKLVYNKSIDDKELF
jgi:hypothetical protein